jgi:hypothetical protein
MFDVGTFTLNGPSTQNVDCPLTTSCVVQVGGIGLASANKAKVTSGPACSSAAAVPTGYAGASFDVAASGVSYSEFNLGTATTGVATSGFRLCWASDTSYTFEVGSFQISGPFVGAVACTLTEACSLQLSGVGLASSNVVRILESGSACGSDVSGVGTFVGLSSTTSASATLPYDAYEVAPTAVTGGTSGDLYRLCWSHAPSGNTDFSFDVGLFTLNGPLTQNVDCTMTLPCAVQVAGTGLSRLNRAKVVSTALSCSTAAATPTGYTGASFDVRVSDFYLLSGGDYREFDMGTTISGLASSGFKLCWAHDSSYAFEVGSFQVSGPHVGATESR